MDSPLKWIRIERQFPLPGYVKDACQKLHDAGYVAYVVGGCVRDFLLFRESKDYDVATDANPDEVVRLFPNAITVGKAFGVLKVPLRLEGASTPEFIEIATFREDLEYKNHRHPTSVRFSGPREDAQRRDFTINALFYDLKTSRILDTVGGMDDLKAGVVRAIGDPSLRFREDALRLLRGVRFATRFGFRLEPSTAEAIAARSKLILKVSSERIRDELTLMLTGPKPSTAIQMLADLGLLKCVLPEVDALRWVSQNALQSNVVRGSESQVFKQTLKLMDALIRQKAPRSATLAWAALLLDVGKPQALELNSKKNFKGHEVEGAKLAAVICERLKMSREEIERVRQLIEDQLKLKDVYRMRESTLLRLIREPHFEELLALHRADATVTDGNLAFYEFAAARFAEFKKNPIGRDSKLLNGEDLIQLGFRPSPRFSEILRTIEDLALEQKLTSKEEALEYVVKHFVG